MEMELPGKNKVVVKLLRENIALQERARELNEVLKKIDSKMGCIGGPLNDNFHKYNKEQRKIFFEFRDMIDEIVDRREEAY